MNKIAKLLAAVGFIGVAQAADLTWTGAENLVPRSEFNKYRLVYDLNIQKEMSHFGWSVQAVPYDIDRSRQVAKGGFSRVAYFVETVSTNGGPFDHRLGPHQGHLRRHHVDPPMRGLFRARRTLTRRVRSSCSGDVESW